MEVQRALAMGRALMHEHGLEDWRLVTDRAKTRAGVCRFARREIGISEPVTRITPEDEVRDTLLHEIAHALVGPQHGHDEVWRARAVSIGCTGQRCSSADAPRVPGDWVGRCAAGHERMRHRAPTRLMSCGRCSRRFDSRHLFTWSYRGRPASLPPSYLAELAALRTSEHPATRVLPRIGDVVRITGGTWAGRVGEVELVGASRLQVRVDDDLVSLPLEVVAPVGERPEVA
ncbi:SprT-like domain-containing protein [Phycicoccus sp. BSK3Z-2]|uniref:SprT-like domain-containing protein n=1 Tax=Phycicoccus avicenniae TaxID=2828860 RepID=A0A941DA89_9MICO|nr:SprT-like domain-containing protein [Phycicoccus avicenniae]